MHFNYGTGRGFAVAVLPQPMRLEVDGNSEESVGGMRNDKLANIDSCPDEVQVRMIGKPTRAFGRLSVVA